VCRDCGLRGAAAREAIPTIASRTQPRYNQPVGWNSMPMHERVQLLISIYRQSTLGTIMGSGNAK
jgi:hypothetical protein